MRPIRFSVRVRDCEARFEMKDHFGTAEAARNIVEPFIREWEFVAALKRAPGDFELHFENAEIGRYKFVTGDRRYTYHGE